MPTPSNTESRGEWTARTDTPRRSVFGNYRPQTTPGEEIRNPKPETRTESEARPEANGGFRVQKEVALARAFIYRVLAKAYEDPTPAGWDWLCNRETRESLCAAVRILGLTIQGSQSDNRRDSDVAQVSNLLYRRLPVASAPAVTTAKESHAERGLEIRDTAGGKPALGDEVAPEGCSIIPTLEFIPAGFDEFHSAYLAVFGHAARGSCPLNEIEYGDIKADPLFQPHRLADLAAFYRAFRLEVAEDAGERHDHICLELEFMCVLAVKEAFAFDQQLEAPEVAQCREAQKKFLREHLGRWAPAFSRRLAAATPDPVLQALADFTRRFIESECSRFDVKPGSDDLLLRPVEDAAESMCASCGISNLPPGAVP